jgi:fumarate hydratase subunit beta
MMISTPLTKEKIEKLKVGTRVLLSGVIYTARDAAHQRLVKAIEKGKKLPLPLKNQIIYYTGPTPAKPGKVIGSAGPTTSSRMDSYTPALLKKGLKGMIGKGERSAEVTKAIKRYKAVYFLATGGAGALLAQRIKKCDLVAYPDLGPEAIYRLEVENFPLIVAIDSQGKNCHRLIGGRENV